MRNVSELGMASFKGQGAVLLPRDVSGDVGQQRSRNAVDALRWGVFGARLDEAQISAAEQYISERMSKREKGMDILVHEPLTQAVKGEFAGLREVNGQSLILIKTAPEVVSVLPIKS
ncbi:conjugal transfer relaxase TraI, partial [Shewanella sairae]|nr:conjugal transfer relaxase TraI [Shewanella sairae]